MRRASATSTPTSEVAIRIAGERDAAAVWRILEPVIRAGETLALPRDMAEAEALADWFAPGKTVFVAEADRAVVGSYSLRANQRGGGAHVANCGYVVDSVARGRGIASALCAHSIDAARAAGFAAIQFNFVVSSNVRAVTLWRRFGFDIVGTLPGAFQHPVLGAVDAFVMFRTI